MSVVVPSPSRPPLCLALDDFCSIDEVLRAVSQTQGLFEYYKIGSAVFTRFGPELIRAVIMMGQRVFLDLKYYDTPTTMALAVSNACELGVSMLTIHTMAGLEAMHACQVAARGRVKLIGVTVLTSLSAPPDDALVDQQKKLARFAALARLDGIVCSPLDLPELRDVITPNMVVIAPGIVLYSCQRMPGQARVCTLDQARVLGVGATLIPVLGRAMTSDLSDGVAQLKKWVW
jgi:orotidine-5'-phosphate decarboxylase